VTERKNMEIKSLIKFFWAETMPWSGLSFSHPSSN